MSAGARCSFKQLPATAATDTFRHHCRTHHIAEDAIDLLASMLSLDPSRRPTAEACLRHPFFANAPAAMSHEQFLAATHNFAGSHEFVVKNKAAKRGRAADPGAVPSSHARSTWLQSILLLQLHRCVSHCAVALMHVCRGLDTGHTCDCKGGAAYRRDGACCGAPSRALARRRGVCAAAAWRASACAARALCAGAHAARGSAPAGKRSRPVGAPSWTARLWRWARAATTTDAIMARREIGLQPPGGRGHR